MGFTDVTYYLEGDSASDSGCTPASAENKPMLREQVETDDITTSLAAAAGIRMIFSWTTEPNDPGVKNLPLGDYTMSFRISRIPSGCFARGRWRIVNGSCTVQAQAVDTGFASSTGTYSYTENFDPPAGNAGDRIQAILEVFFTSGATDDFTIDVDHADSFITVPVGFTNPTIWLPNTELVGGAPFRL